MIINIRDGYNGWFPRFPTSDMVPVLCLVTLRQAVFFNDSYKGDPITEIRAAEAEIEHMYVADDLMSTTEVETIARRLAIAFSVYVTTGAPTYTKHDWNNRPDWMRRGPIYKVSDVDSIWKEFPRCQIS